MSTIKVRFLIHKEHKHVVFAEGGSDFVDLLFSFLTLPLGRIVRLLSKQSSLGPLHSLYESIEQMDASNLQNEACKEMLINPRSSAALQCEDLKIKGIHERNPRRFYICSQDDCLIQSICYYTYTSKSLCSRCGKLMDKQSYWKRNTSDKGGVFVIDPADFLITDDLQVTPPSFRRGLSLFKQLQVKDSSVFEEKVMELGTEEALNLLGKSLVSKNALTQVCFPDACAQTSEDFSLSSKEELIIEEAKKEISLELIFNKKDNKVLYAEVGDDFVNQLFSFLTFPLGSVLKFLSGNISSLGGCIHNLYSSAERMNEDLFKSKIYRSMLLTPALPTFYGMKNQIFELEEIKLTKPTVLGSCLKCYIDNGCKTCTSAICVHGISESEYIEQKPQSTNETTDNGRAFVISSRRFMISDDFHISPLSLISAMSNGKNLPLSDLIRREVFLDKTKVLSLLSVMLVSKATLTDIFSPKSMPRMGSRHNYP